MQIGFGFSCFVLVGVMAAATAAFHIDTDGMYDQELMDQYALGHNGKYLRTADYLDILRAQEQLDGAEEEEEGEDGGKGRGKGKGKGRGRGKGKGKGKSRGGEGGEGGEAAAAAFESLFD